MHMQDLGYANDWKHTLPRQRLTPLSEDEGVPIHFADALDVA